MKCLPLMICFVFSFALSGCFHLGPGQPGFSLTDGSTEYLAGYGPRGARVYDPRTAPDRNQPRASIPANPSVRIEQGFWDDEGVSGKALIRLNRSEQRAYFYKGNQLVGVSPISTGKEGHGTPAGTYQVTEKDVDHVSSVYGVIRDKLTNEVINPDADIRRDRIPAGAYFDHAPMPFFLRFNRGIGMHQGYLPGYPASHGCVRMPEHMARHFFENASKGTPVIVE